MSDQLIEGEKLERYMGPISSSLRPEADGEWVRYEDAATALYALSLELGTERSEGKRRLLDEHEQRVKVESDLATWKAAAEARDKQVQITRDQLYALQARLSGWIEELERRASEKVDARDARRERDNSQSGRETLARIDGEAYGLRAAAFLIQAATALPRDGEERCAHSEPTEEACEHCLGTGEKHLDDGEIVDCPPCKGTGQKP